MLIEKLYGEKVYASEMLSTFGPELINEQNRILPNEKLYARVFYKTEYGIIMGDYVDFF